MGRSSMSWRRFFPAIFLFSCVDGFISNWLHPARLPLLYRDILILGVYLLFVSQEPVGGWLRQVRARAGPGAWLLAECFLLVGFVQIFNPLSQSLLVGVLGFNVLFLYWPLAILAYAYVDTQERARWLLKTIVYFSVPVNVFGLYQFWQGPKYLVSAFGPGFERATIVAHIEGFGDEESFLRIIGTFASTGQFSLFLAMNAMLCIALLFSSTTKWERLVFSGCAALTFLTMLATGSRGGLLILVLEAIAFGMLHRRVRRAVVVASLAGISLYFGFQWLGEGVITRFESLRDVEMIRHRTFETTPAMFTELLQEFPLGHGLGSGSPASRHILGDDSLEWRLVENTPSKLQLETGILGVILFYSFVIMLSLRWLRNWHTSLDPVTFDFVAPIAAYCLTRFALSFVTGGFDSPPASVFFWALVGIVAKLSGLSKAVRGRAIIQFPAIRATGAI